MLKMAEMLPQDWEIDYEDLGNVYAREQNTKLQCLCFYFNGSVCMAMQLL